MTWSIQPEPSDEAERLALLAALEQALAEEQAGANGRVTSWWRSGFDDFEGGLDEAQLSHRAALDAPTLRPQSRR